MRSNGKVAPNVVVVSFECTSPAMDFFRDRVFTIGESERSLIAQIITEARQLFSSVLDDPYLKKMELSANPPFGWQFLHYKLCLQFLFSYSNLSH